MKNTSKMGAKIDAQVVSNPSQKARFLASTHWEWEHYRDGKLIDTWGHDNVCTNEGLNALLNIMFNAGTQITTWYVEIFETDTTPDGDTTYAVPVYTPSTAYDEETRPEYVDVTADAKVMTNTASKAVFTISATKTIYGAALVGGGSAATTKGNVAGGGTMYCAAKFSAAKSVVDDDVLSVTIQITAADA